MPSCKKCSITLNCGSSNANECAVNVFVCLSDAIHTTTVRTTVRNAPACEARTVCRAHNLFEFAAAARPVSTLADAVLLLHDASSLLATLLRCEVRGAHARLLHCGFTYLNRSGSGRTGDPSLARGRPRSTERVLARALLLASGH